MPYPLFEEDIPLLEDFLLEGGNVTLGRHKDHIVVKMSIKAARFSIDARGTSPTNLSRALRNALDVLAEKMEKIFTQDGGWWALNSKMPGTVRGIVATYDITGVP